MATATTATTTSRKLVALVTHPIQYQAPMFRYLAQDPELELVVVFLEDRRAAHDPGFERRVDWDVPLLKGYEHRFLVTGRRARITDAWALFRSLRKERADALWIHGWGHSLTRLALIAGRNLAKSVFVRGETRLAPGWLRSVYHRFLLGRADAALAIGKDNAEFLRTRGVPAARIFSVPYAVDAARFGVERAEPRESLIVLFVGKLQPHKRPLDLARAVQHLRSLSVPIEAWFVGSGPLAADLRELAPDGRVFGFVNQEELPSIYAQADVLCVPSEFEPWGLVANEAAHAGLALLLSDAVGAASDLVVGGETGFTFPVGDMDTLVGLLAELAHDRRGTRRLGERARARASASDFESDRLGLRAALGSVSF